MAATVESVIQQPVTKSHRHRGAFALAAGLVVAGALATTVVLADNSDGPSPAAQVQVSTEAPIGDPLITRFGTQSSAAQIVAKAGTDADRNWYGAYNESDNESDNVPRLTMPR